MSICSLRRSRLLAVGALLVACATPDDPAPTGTSSSAAGATPSSIAFPDASKATEASTHAMTWTRGRRPADGGDVIAVALGSLPHEVLARTLSIEGIDAPGPGAAVVTVLVACEGRTPCRLAIAVVSGPSGARATGHTWPVPAPSVATADLSTEPLADPAVDLAVRDALVRAGLDASRLAAISIATDAWPIVAHLDRSDASGPVVWLRRDGDRLVVAGTTGQEKT